jgi:hypothetical protein
MNLQLASELGVVAEGKGPARGAFRRIELLIG